MIRKVFLCLSVVLLIPLFALSGYDNKAPDKSIAGLDSSFTTSDVNLAFNAFNNYFYNQKKNLYYKDTRHSGLAAIWTQAIYLEMVMDAYQRTKNSKYLRKVNDIFQGGYDQYDAYNWNNKRVWFIYDDMMWWISALARAYRITGNQKYLTTSIAGFKRVWDSAYDAKRGGMFWQFNHKSKNACINYPTIIAAMRLYKITSDRTYLNKAKKYIVGHGKTSLIRKLAVWLTIRW